MTLDRNIHDCCLEKLNSGHVEESAERSALAFKQRKTRRGKKKRFRSTGEEETHITSDKIDQKEEEITKEQERLEAMQISKKKKKLSSVIIRPIHVPKAPENSTQFIIDDHEDSQLYISFEKPFSDSNSSYEDKLNFENCFGEPSRPYINDAAFQDIDYEYESPDDFDTTEFYARDFETAYNKARFDELVQLPHEQLVDMYHHLEQQAIELQDQLVQYDPVYALDELQQELLKCQEENKVLRQRHKLLQSELNNEIDDQDFAVLSSTDENFQGEISTDESEV